jgi:tRNA-specific adenosine deaminase 3
MSVPATQAESTGQLSQWGSIWPITYIPLHAGPRGHLLPRRWTREHVDWARKGLQRVGRLAAEATAKGEVRLVPASCSDVLQLVAQLPIACMVANNFDPRQADLDPVELTYSQDTRTSTGNTLCHAYRNLIASVADLDRRGVRSGPLTPPTARGATLPYLLTGMTLFATHEPCLLCSMALLHSRVQYLVYAVASPGAGGCGSVYDVHEDEGLNHKFEVWHWREFVDGLTVVEVDP